MARIKRTSTLLACLLVFLQLAACHAVADEIGGPTEDDAARGSSTRAMGAGLLAGAAAFTTGLVAGNAMYQDPDDELSGLEAGLVIGSVMGGIALPLGVHAGNHRRGNGWAVLGTSLAVGAAGWAIALGAEEAFVLPMTAVGQLVACTAMEMATMPEPDSAATASASAPTAVAPAAPRLAIGATAIDGKPGLLIAGSF